MMRAQNITGSACFFLFVDDNQDTARSYGKQSRVYRPHHKSRNGCLACKRRRVKCDECLPCGSCVKRREKCERPVRRPPQPPHDDLVRQPSSSSHHVNTLHIELFHHFENVTRYTLSFQEIWELQLQESFKHEYLMHAILATAAKHLSVLRPHDPRYAEAAIVLLNKSLQSFRETLDTTITPDNCEARLGTSVLINYMAWTELGFLDGQGILADPGAGGLDMSKDLLFLLGSGFRQVFYTAFPLFEERDSPFIKVGQYHPCDHLEAEADERGAPWRDIMHRLIYLFDDPSYQGNPTKGSSPSQHSSSSSSSITGAETDSSLDHVTSATSSPASSATSYTTHYLQRIIERNTPANAVRLKTEGLTNRTLYERIAQRLAVLLSLIPDSGESDTESLTEARRLDVERYFFSFPTLCLGPFLSLILDNDSRALVIMHHMYRAARRLLRFDKTWWAAERAATMERLTLAELKARGLGAGI